MKINSLDPRISRSDLPEENEYSPKVELDQFETYEVFHQTSRGAQHVHVGSVHAPNLRQGAVCPADEMREPLGRKNERDFGDELRRL